jgi:hypothetical protein
MAKASSGKTRIEREVDRLGTLVRKLQNQVDAVRTRVSDLEWFGGELAKFGVRHTHRADLAEFEVEPAGKGKDLRPKKARRRQPRDDR